ncbi:class D sortase [Aureibacillus halotolerans]|uniref:Sortase A n=1 Tax=Aureibacillus halotolerans TaxID=1508390 RepID=A0A4R6U8E1_9BACI|nr:class D sortase [Aureibacillus halotolerans]TDQ42066.1 sortase A [Aureibacillus halotolerans]
MKTFILWLSVLFMVSGVVCLFYQPWLGWQLEKEQSYLLNELNSNRVQENQQLTEVFNRGETKPHSHRLNGPIAELQIPSIDALMPVVNGTSAEELQHAAGRMESTAMLGSQGNTALAAHRSFTDGALFSRLDEVKLGDSVIITTQQDVLTYVVYAAYTVQPDDVYVLQSSEMHHEITLITCEPMKNPTHRLIVKAALERREVIDSHVAASADKQ